MAKMFTRSELRVLASRAAQLGNYERAKSPTWHWQIALRDLAYAATILEAFIASTEDPMPGPLVK